MDIKIAYSNNSETNKILDDIKEQIGKFKPKFILFFINYSLDYETINKELGKMFPNVPEIIGCVSGIEFCNGNVYDNSLVMMALSDKVIIKSKSAIIKNISSDYLSVDNALAELENYFDYSIEQLPPHKYFGILLMDGLVQYEDFINRQLQKKTNIEFVGGLSSDYFKYKETSIFVNGEKYNNVAVFVILESAVNFNIFKTQAFKSIRGTVEITKMGNDEKTVVELNNKPAAKELARIFNLTEEELKNNIYDYSVGLELQDDFFVKSIQKIEGNSVIFWSNVYEGVTLNLFKNQDILSKTLQDLNSNLGDVENIAAIINFDCLGRVKNLKKRNAITDYAAILKDIPNIGFGTYGECYIGHFNQSSVMLVLKTK